MRRSSFGDATLSEGAAALNIVFQQYVIPVMFSAEQLRLHITINDVQPALSPIWFDEVGGVLAAALLAVRGKRGWIGGFGVAPAYRGQGYARALIEHVLQTGRERGLESISLEVLSENAPAIGVYRNAGFEVTRRLLSFETVTPQANAPQGFAYVSPDELIDAPQPAVSCWQREAASLRNGAASSAVSDGNGTYALFRSTPALAQVLKLNAQSAQDLNELTRAMAMDLAFERIFVLNEPEESPLTGYAREAGWTERFTQYEMLVPLSC